VGGCESTPHGFVAVLEAALEHGTQLGYGIEDERGRAGLERIAGEVSRSSKLGRTARSLLDLPVDGAARGRLVAAAEAAVRPATGAAAT
jgi:hypothetical protein